MRDFRETVETVTQAARGEIHFQVVATKDDVLLLRQAYCPMMKAASSQRISLPAVFERCRRVQAPGDRMLRKSDGAESFGADILRQYCAALLRGALPRRN